MARRARSRRSTLRGFSVPVSLHPFNFKTIPDANTAWYDWKRKHPHYRGPEPSYRWRDWHLLAEHHRMLEREDKAALRAEVEAQRRYLRPKSRSISASFSST